MKGFFLGKQKILGFKKSFYIYDNFLLDSLCFVGQNYKQTESALYCFLNNFESEFSNFIMITTNDDKLTSHKFNSKVKKQNHYLRIEEVDLTKECKSIIYIDKFNIKDVSQYSLEKIFKNELSILVDLPEINANDAHKENYEIKKALFNILNLLKRSNNSGTKSLLIINDLFDVGDLSCEFLEKNMEELNKNNISLVFKSIHEIPNTVIQKKLLKAVKTHFILSTESLNIKEFYGQSNGGAKTSLKIRKLKPNECFIVSNGCFLNKVPIELKDINLGVY